MHLMADMRWPSDMSHFDLKTLLEICESGNAVADFELANRYLVGRGVRKNRPKAFGLYLKASQDPENHLFGFVHEALGDCHYYGLGTHVDERAAFLSYLTGAQCGYVKSIFSVGLAHVNGYGTPTDILKGIEYLECAAKLNYAEAEFELGCTLLEDGPLHDERKGEELITRAAYQGHAAAQVKKAKLISKKALPASSQAIAGELLCESYAWLNLASATNPIYGSLRDIFLDKDQAWLIRGQMMSREIGQRIVKRNQHGCPQTPSEMTGLYNADID